MDEIDIINVALGKLGLRHDGEHVVQGRTDMGAYNVGHYQLVNFFPMPQPRYEHVMEIPKEIGEIVRLAAYTNRWGEQCLFALGQNGKTYLVKAEEKQMVEAIAPRGVFD